MLVFEKGENQSIGRNTSRVKDENQQQTQPTNDAESGNRTRATLVEGECSHHCTIPAPRVVLVTQERDMKAKFTTSVIVELLSCFDYSF